MTAGSRFDLSIGLPSMQHFNQHPRRDLSFVTYAIALLTALALIPSHAVAQGAKTSAGKAEPPAGKAAAPAGNADSNADEPAKASEPPPRSNSGRGFSSREDRGASRGTWSNWQAGEAARAETLAKQQKLLVGTWRGGRADGEVTFSANGVFEEFPQTLYWARHGDEPNVQGRWQFRDSNSAVLQMSVDATGASLRGLPSTSRQGTNTIEHRIILLDENFLRVGDPNSGVLFFRRVDEPAARPTLADDLPENIRRLAILAELSPDDAAALAQPKIDWLKEWQVSEAQLKLIERVALARRGKMDLAELFELSPEEATAYAELYRLTQANFKAIEQLADKEQLTPLELATVKKLRAARDEFERGIGAMKIGTAKIRLGERDVAPKLDAKTLQALGKLYPAIDRLAEFPNATVFAEPAAPAPGPRGFQFRREQ
jgi:hypothetical protein